MTNSKTVSERLFEDFLTRNGVPFDPIPQATTPRPDYLVKYGGAAIIFEVKELSEDADFCKEPLQVSSRTVGAHIRSKITEARKQIQYGAQQGLPSVLLIYNDIDPMQLFGTEDHDFATAMYGEYTLRIGMEKGNIIDRFHGRNRYFEIKKNTSFSALARIAVVRSETNITIFENAFANVPLPYSRLPSCFELVRANYNQDTTERGYNENR